MAGTLYIVSTPIGNLKDISPRAISVLKEADIIACEDSRQTSKLLNRYSIRSALTSYHEHNEMRKSAVLLDELKNGKNIALVSDAGSPSISDPGYRIIRLANENGIRIVPVPGPSAVTTALAASGLPTDKFLFLGFLPKTKNEIEKLSRVFGELPVTLIFFESPKRIKKTIWYLLEFLGDREASVCRELTKIHEEILSGTLSNLSESLQKRKTIKGEITLVIKGYERDKPDSSESDIQSAVKRLKSLKKLGLSLKDSVKVVSEDFNMTKKVIYEMALNIWGN